MRMNKRIQFIILIFWGVFISLFAQQTYTPGTNLVTSEWNQLSPYNIQLPIIGPGRAAVGCTALGMAQLMRFHRHPSAAFDVSFSDYITTTQKEHIAGFEIQGLRFDWDIFKDHYRGGVYTPEEAEAVSTLLKVVCQALQSDFKDETTAAPFTTSVMSDYFDYAPAIRTIKWVDVGDAFEEILRLQIASRMPVYFSAARASGAGHGFLVDGYNDDGKFHIKWGWGGQDDGWYDLDIMNVTMGSPFVKNHEMKVNITPNTATSQALAEATNLVEKEVFVAARSSIASRTEAMAVINEVLERLDLGEGVRYRVIAGGKDTATFSTSAIGDESVAVEFKFVVCLTKDSLTFTTNALALTLLNFAGGDGTVQSPFEIADASQLSVLPAVVNSSREATRNLLAGKHFRLVADIDLSAFGNWTPIGTFTNRAFSGVFDGNDKVIRGLRISSEIDNQGLFGVVRGAVIKNLGVEDAVITGKDNVAPIAASFSGTISHCYSTGRVTGEKRIGGIVGWLTEEGSVVENSYSKASLHGVEQVGGIAAYLDTATTVRSCAALNSSITATQSETPRIYRIMGTYRSEFTLENNVALETMLVNNGRVSSTDPAHRHGANISQSQINRDRTLGGRVRGVRN